MKANKLALFLAALALSASSQAAVLLGTGGSPNPSADYSAPGLVSFDLDLKNFAPTTFSFVLEQDDLLGPLSFNALVRNLSGSALTHFSFNLQGIGFAQAGSVSPTFGKLGQAAIGANGHSAGVDFSAPEWAEFHFGNPLGVAGNTDWLLSTEGLRAGDTFSITAAVPEPSSAALMLAALCSAGLVARRRRQD
jgi:hypothetical protein